MIPALSRFLLPLLLTAIAGAQVQPIKLRDASVDSGVIDNASLAFTQVFAHDIVVPDAVWLRIHFGDTTLPRGSHLLITSADDGAQQRFDAGSLEDYSGRSAVFNGGRVLVELIAGPQTVGNHVSVDKLEIGVPTFPVEDSICELSDERKLSNDPRVARAYGSDCTIWMVNEHTFVTAGHCAQASTMALFNVPLSSLSGTPRFPPPDHQYALDLSTLRMASRGVGQDWAVVSSVRNSNHHSYAGQKQGWFKLGAIPEMNFHQQTIRITGFGAVNRPVSPTWNGAQKTQVGPGASVANAINYRTDTTDGNSGSPVILESTGEVIGIHTHGGCTPFDGTNSGTRIDLPALQTAINEVAGSKVAGGFSLFGEGCAGTFGVPLLSMAGIPDIGDTVYATVLGVAPSSTGILMLGLSASRYAGQDLPIALDSFGLEGCTLHVRPDIQIPVLTGIGVVSYPIVIPNDPALIELQAFLQFVGVDPGAGNTLGAVVSNAAQVKLGG